MIAYVLLIDLKYLTCFFNLNRYLSTGHIDVNNKTGIEILNVIIASDELKLNKLTKFVEDYFIEHREFLQNDPVGILQIIYHHKLFINLQEICLEMICFKPEILFNSVKFVNLPAFLLEIILKREDLYLVEIKIWENLIKWGLAQEKTLDEDISRWNQDKFKIFERILHKLIPLIRFCDISSEDYFYKVRPYEEILPKGLQGEILKFYMVSGYTPTLDNFLSRHAIGSNMINRKHLILFTSWIDRVDKDIVYKIPYRYKLLYRASRDGNTAAAFHAKCDNKGATIVIAKIKNSEQIIGGYNPLFWNSNNSDMTTKDSFIFSITDKNNLQSANLVYSKGDQYSVRGYAYYGPRFGHTDLYLYNNILYSTAYSYPTLNLPNNIRIDDYEVFQVIKK
jgi:hypothetical protein